MQLGPQAPGGAAAAASGGGAAGMSSGVGGSTGGVGGAAGAPTEPPGSGGGSGAAGIGSAAGTGAAGLGAMAGGAAMAGSSGAAGMPRAGSGGAGPSAGEGGAGAAGAAGAAAAGASGAPAPRMTRYRNPLNASDGSDPWIVYHEGYYYLTATTWSSRLTIARATTLDDLRSAEPMTVWEGDERSRCCNMWAPELHLLDGPSGRRWYLYYTAGPAGMNTDNQRMHVLESAGTDPLGPYAYKARLFDPATDSWAIDGSVVRLEGRLYYLYSAWEGDNQNIYIAAMRNPWTLSSGRSRLSTPTYAWERMLANVNEAPVALQRGEDTFVIYSASACWGPDYKLGMLRFMGGDPLSPRAWRKSAEPVFVRADDNDAYGPGHNGFFKSPDGTEDWIVYHANASEAGVCDTKRTTRAQRFEWNADGTPRFGAPVGLGVELPGPSGE